MLLDATLQFSSAQAITTTAVSQNQIDFAALADMGIGYADMELACYVGTAFAGGTSLNVQLQGSVDNATYTTIVETGVILTAALTANQKIPLTLTHRGTNQPIYRYLQLNYVVVGTYTGGIISYAGLVVDRDENSLPFYKSGYTVGA